MFEPAFVIDASVFVADAQPQEPFHADANLLLETLAAHGRVLHAPAIVLSEIAAALARGAGAPDLAREAVSRKCCCVRSRPRSVLRRGEAGVYTTGSVEVSLVRSPSQRTSWAVPASRRANRPSAVTSGRATCRASAT